MFDIHPVVELAAYCALVSSFVLSTWLTWNIFRPRSHHSMRSVAILVLGDIGRSPRMMYHAQSFAENDFLTDIIGYGGVFNNIFMYSPDSHPLQDQSRFHL